MLELANAAEALRKAAMKPAPGQPKPTFAQLKALKADLNAKRTILIQEIITDHSCTTLGAGCFGAGTKLWTELGYRNIEDIQPGERVYSRDQWDAGGEIAAKIVEEVFTRFAGIWEVVAGGQTIRTTSEHLFFVVGKGWTPAINGMNGYHSRLRPPHARPVKANRTGREGLPRRSSSCPTS